MIVIVCILLASSVSTAKDLKFQKNGKIKVEEQKIDSNIYISSDFNVTVDILEIRKIDRIDFFSDPDFFVKVIIEGEEFSSNIWNDKWYLYNPCSFSKKVENQNIVNITIQLWDENFLENRICDLGPKTNEKIDGYEVNLVYDLRTGHWSGDDYIGDESGLGRVCGCDDGSIYEKEYDCELWFNIYQDDFDNDGLPSWVETNVYHTDPLVDNTGEDLDGDGIPIEWEHFWGFNPLIWDGFRSMDPDCDSINTSEEYLARDFNSDPFRRDIFMEIDFMETGPNGEYNIVEDEAFEMLKTPFHRRNIVFHVDAGEVNGGDLVPFDDDVKSDEVIEIYENYFIKNESDAWRRGVFHYSIIVYSCNPGGYAFCGDLPPHWGYTPGTNSFMISSSLMDKHQQNVLASNSREYLYASCIMHEMGHNFGLRWGHPFGVDCQFGKYPWHPSYWIFGNYKSIMNYRYTYNNMDYSDGSHGRRDHDDWENIDLSYFEYPPLIKQQNRH